VLFQAVNEGLIAISLLNYYDCYDKNEVQNSVVYLNKNIEKNFNNLYYPESIDEVNLILKKYV
jgi:hypothetical protein